MTLFGVQIKARLKNNNKNFPNFLASSLFWKNHPQVVDKRKRELTGKI